MFVAFLVLPFNLYLDPFEDSYVRKKFKNAFCIFHLFSSRYAAFLPVLHSLFLEVLFFCFLFFLERKSI